MVKVGIFIEIASVALLPRNDGILEFSVMRSSGQVGDDTRQVGMTQGLGIWNSLKFIIARL